MNYDKTRQYAELSPDEREFADSINQFINHISRLFSITTKATFETPRIEYWGSPILFATAVFRAQVGDQQMGMSLRIDPHEILNEDYFRFMFHNIVREYADYVLASDEE